MRRRRARVSQVGAKQLLRRVFRGERDEDASVQEAYRSSLHGPEYAEGVQAFLAQREPDFRAARGRQ